MRGLDDISLVARVAVFHDNKAFDKLVVRYQSPIRRFFLNQTLGDTQLSDDLAQDTFIKAYANIAQFKGMSAFSTWLFRIAYNVLYDHSKRKRQTCDIDTSGCANKLSEQSHAAAGLDIYGALARLGDKERTCITLQLVDGYPINDIAKITNMSPGTVKSHLFRGKNKLANYLRNNGYEGKR